MKKCDRITVAVDGPAGSGKSSVCRKVAIDLGMKYIDSGAMYRSVTLFYLGKFGDIQNVSSVDDYLEDIEIFEKFKDDGTIEVWLNGSNVSKEIRDEKITKSIGFFSDKVSVRNYVNSILRDWSAKESIIMDGRDIGSVVFPEADLKLYLDASVDVRTERRVKEYFEMGKKVDEKSIRNQIIQRDFEDMNREVGALKKVDDAVYIDTSELSFPEVVDALKDKIKTMITNR